MEVTANKHFSQILLSGVFLILLAIPIIMGYHPHSAEEDAFIDTVGAVKQYGFYLEDVSDKSGIRFMHQAPELDPEINPILPQVASMGASVAICDFNNDDWNDIYVTTSRVVA